ncbi:MAG: translation elongation factor-like protein [Candidatus Omnitrophica bacterium]|nr:translation elongation factor-like protein [Candidatus Omnitrophota bacterium]MBU4472600.1 translation elongation factor-like protein [Candidatus Omnitrophota bacterium]
MKKSVKKARKAAPRVKKVEGKVIGKVTHYFPHVNAGVIKLKAPLAVGDTIKIKGHTTDLTQTITSMQIDRVPITQGKKGDEIGLLVDARVRGNDIVYKV